MLIGNHFEMFHKLFCVFLPPKKSLVRGNLVLYYIHNILIRTFLLLGSFFFPVGKNQPWIHLEKSLEPEFCFLFSPIPTYAG